MAGKKCVVGGIEFALQRDLVEHCRSAVSATADGDMIACSDFMLNLIRQRHREPDEKILPGLEDEIVGVRVRHESAKKILQKAGRNHTFVVYRGGLEISFSWVQCCEGFRDARGWLTQAMRRAVDRDIRSYKKLRFAASSSLVSDASGVPITWGTCQVDHFPVTFAKLRDDFLEHWPAPAESVLLTQDDKGGWVLGDAEFERCWGLYHQSHCTLRLVTPEENKTSWRSDGAISGKRKIKEKE